MKAETIEKIFNFLKEKEGKRLPINWKIFLAKENIIRKLENHPDGTQYIHHGYSDLRNTNIKKLPKDFYTDDNLILSGCKQLTQLPDKLHVGGFLHLSDCNQLTELPDNVYVKDSLVLDGTNITELPNNLYVGWNLYIKDTPLAKKYTDEEIKDIVTSKGGTIKARIIR